ncbi:hypothetical protein RUM43_001774, partial [Polyplax serrata]
EISPVFRAWTWTCQQVLATFSFEYCETLEDGYPVVSNNNAAEDTTRPALA